MVESNPKNSFFAGLTSIVNVDSMSSSYLSKDLKKLQDSIMDH